MPGTLALGELSVVRPDPAEGAVVFRVGRAVLAGPAAVALGPDTDNVPYLDVSDRRAYPDDLADDLVSDHLPVQRHPHVKLTNLRVVDFGPAAAHCREITAADTSVHDGNVDIALLERFGGVVKLAQLAALGGPAVQRMREGSDDRLLGECSPASKAVGLGLGSHVERVRGGWRLTMSNYISSLSQCQEMARPAVGPR